MKKYTESILFHTDKATKKANVKLKELTTAMTAGYDPGATETSNNVNVTSGASQLDINLITPVPFVQPVADNIIVDSGGAQFKKYGTNSVKRSGMFPYMYKNSEGTSEGYIDTTLSTSSSDIATLKNK